MPRPLPAPDTPEGAFYTDLTERPLNAAAHQYLADWQAERGPLGPLREVTEALRFRCAQVGLPLPALADLELLRGATLIDRECDRVATEAHALLSAPAIDTGRVRALERDLSAALGPPRGDAPRLLDEAGNLDPGRLREQYAFQHTLLASLGLLEERGPDTGIMGIDSAFHPLPSLDAIATRLQTPALRRKVAQGFDRLLLVPFALPLPLLLDAWRQGLRRNEHLLKPSGGLDPQTPLWLWEQYQREEPVYFPERFAPDHDGQTKRDLLEDPTHAWHALLVEGALTDLPRAGHGRTVGGRPQLVAGHSANDYLSAQLPDEVGWTPECYAVAFLTELEARGGVLDAGTLSYLTAAYLPSSGYVPRARWGPLYLRSNLGGNRPDFADPAVGARAAVQIL